MENKKLSKDLRKLQDEVEDLKKDRNNLSESNKIYRLNVSVNKEGILEYEQVN